LIIDSNAGKKLYVSDNIAPRPRTWDLKGYIGADPWELLASPLLQITQAKKLGYLREMRDSREMLVFKTKNGGELVFVGIKDLTIDSDPAVQNRIPVSLSLQEMPILAYENGQLGVPTGSTNISAESAKIGQVASVSLTSVAIAGSLALLVEGFLTVDDAMNIPNNKKVKNRYSIPMPSYIPGVRFNFDAKVKGLKYNLRE